MSEEKSVSRIWATHAGGSGKFDDGQSHIDWACRRVEQLEREVVQLKADSGQWQSVAIRLMNLTPLPPGEMDG